jgi:hypothetical protein
MLSLLHDREARQYKGIFSLRVAVLAQLQGCIYNPRSEYSPVLSNSIHDSKFGGHLSREERREKGKGKMKYQ